MSKRSAIVVAAALAMIVSVVGWAAGSAGAQAPGCLPTSDRTLGKHGFPGLGIRVRGAGRPSARVAVPTLYTEDALQWARDQVGGDPAVTVMGPHGPLAGPRPLGDPVLMHELDALNSEGFVSATRQKGYVGIGKTRKSHSYGGQGEATTVQLGSPEQAQAYLNRNLAKNPRGKRFTVAAIPGSQGLRHWARPRRQGAFTDLRFTDGDYYFYISRWDFALPGRAGHDDHGDPIPAEGVRLDLTPRLASRGTKSVTNAAINLYNRVHGAAVCP